MRVMTRSPRPAPALVASAVLAAFAVVIWLAGRDVRLPVLLVRARDTEVEWLATVAAGLRGAYGENLTIGEARWTLDLSDIAAGAGEAGPRVPVATVLERIPWVPRDPSVAVVCNLDLRRDAGPSSEWIHGTGLPEGLMVLSIRRVVAEHALDAARLRVALLAAHEFGHVLGYAHCRDRSLMTYVRPGQDLALLEPGLSVEDAFELAPRMLVRERLGTGVRMPFLLLVVPLLALPGLAAVCVVWHGLRSRFGGARVHGFDLVHACFLHFACVAVTHYGWSVLLPAVMMLHAAGARLLPRPGGAPAMLGTFGLALLLGAAGTLADLGYLSGGATFDALAVDPEALAALPGSILSVHLLRAASTEPVEGRHRWGARGWAMLAAGAVGGAAAWLFSPSAVLGGIAVGFGAVRVLSIRTLRIELPGPTGPR